MPRSLRLVPAIVAVLAACPLYAQPLVYVTDPPSNSLVAVESSNNTILRTLPNLAGARAVAISSDGTRVYVAEASDGKIAILDATKISNPNENPLIKELNLGGQPIALALSSDGQKLYVADAANNQVEAVVLSSGDVGRTYAAGTGVNSFAFSPTGYLAIGAADKTITLYALPQQSGGSAVKTVVGLTATPKALAFGPLGQTLWIATGAGFASYALASGTLNNHAEGGGTTSVAFDVRLGLAYFGAGSGNLVYTYAPGAGTAGRIGTYGPVSGLALSADGTRLYASQNCSNCGIAVISTAQGQALSQTSFGTGPATRGQFAGPGNIYAPDTATSTSVGEQISGTVSATDRSARSLSYTVLDGPTLGQLTLNATGDYAYTPAADYSGLQSFVWEASASSGEGSPNLPLSRPITETFAIYPTLSAIADQHASSGGTVGPLTFSIDGSMPFTVAVSSSDSGVVAAKDAVVSSGCGTSSLSCTLTLPVGSVSDGTALITLTVTGTAGLQASTSFKVIVGNGGGGGGSGGFAFIGLVALAFLSTFFALRRRKSAR